MTSLSNKFRFVTLSLVLSMFSSFEVHAENTSYYIDSNNGNDKADGISELSAWKTLMHIKQITFEPGDKILFKAGGRWQGQLKLKGAGTAENPIKVGRYGQGKLPLIAGEGKAKATVVLENGSHWVIENLEVTNTIPSSKRLNGMKGVSVEANAGGVFKKHYLEGGFMFTTYLEAGTAMVDKGSLLLHQPIKKMAALKSPVMMAFLLKTAMYMMSAFTPSWSLAMGIVFVINGGFPVLKLLSAIIL